MQNRTLESTGNATRRSRAHEGGASYPNGARSAARGAREPSRRPGRRARARRRLALAAGAAWLVACSTVPITGRRSFNVFTVQQDVALGNSALQEVLEGQEVVTSGPQAEMVQRVMDRLVAVSDDPGFEWEVRLLRDDATANAFALPGGKMAVYTGILPVTQTEAGLAVVMGHEIAHVIAQHGSERVTQSLGIDVAFSLLDLGDYQSLARTTVALAVELPYSRDHESEADHIGLIYMARAGYDPHEAVRFWERMNQGGGGGGGVLEEWTSTHPSHATRIQRLQELMPEALAELRP